MKTKALVVSLVLISLSPLVIDKSMAQSANQTENQLQVVEELSFPGQIDLISPNRF